MRSRSSSRCSPSSSATLGAEHPNTLASRYNLANAYQAAGRTEDAIAILEPLLADLERVLGAEHPNTLRTRGNLADAYQAGGPHRRTRSRSSSRCSPTASGSSAPSTPTRSPRRGNLANAYQAAGRTQDAIAIFEPLLADLERDRSAPSIPNTLSTRGNLANAYQDAGRTRTRSRSSSRCSPTSSGRSAPSTPTRCAPAATSPTPTRTPAAPQDAIAIYEPLLADRERVLGAEHPDTLSAPRQPRQRLPGRRAHAGRDRDPRAAARRPRADPRRRAPRHARAAAATSPTPTRPAGRTDDAIAILEPLLADLERILGAEHPDTLASRGNLANAYQAAGRTDDAIAILEPLLADLERILGAEHPDTLASRGNLANAYQAAGRTDGRDRDLRAAARRPRADPRRRASRHARQPRQPRQRLPGRRAHRRRDRDPRAAARRPASGRSAPSIPTRSRSRGNLANAYQDAGRTDDAIAILEPLLADLERTLGAEHPTRSSTRNNLANAYQDAGRTDDAIAILEPLLADLERILGAEHPNTLRTRNNLAIVLPGRRPRRRRDRDPRAAARRPRARSSAPSTPTRVGARNNLANAYEAAGRGDDAAASRGERPPTGWDADCDARRRDAVRRPTWTAALRCAL